MSYTYPPGCGDAAEHGLNLRLLRATHRPNAEPALPLARDLLEAGRESESLRVAWQALQEGRAHDPEELLTYARGWLERGNLARAQRWSTEAARRAPGWAEPWRTLAQVLAERGDGRRAAAVWARAWAVEGGAGEPEWPDWFATSPHDTQPGGPAPEQEVEAAFGGDELGRDELGAGPLSSVDAQDTLRDPAGWDWPAMEGEAGPPEETGGVSPREAHADPAPAGVDPEPAGADLEPAGVDPEPAGIEVQVEVELDLDEPAIALRDREDRALRLAARLERFYLEPGTDDPTMLMRELLLLGRVSDAVDVGLLALGPEPDDPDLLLVYAQALESHDDPGAAQLALERATECDPEWVEPWLKLAALGLRCGEEERTRQALARATELAPTHPSLGRLHAQTTSTFGPAPGAALPTAPELDQEVDVLLAWLDHSGKDQAPAAGRAVFEDTLPGIASPGATSPNATSPNGRDVRGRARAWRHTRRPGHTTAVGIGAVQP